MDSPAPANPDAADGAANPATPPPERPAMHAAAMRAHSQTHAEMARRARIAQRDTLTPAVQAELGLDRLSITPPALRRNSSAPNLSRLDDGLPKIVIGICGRPAGTVAGGLLLLSVLRVATTPKTPCLCAAMDKKARSKQMNHIVERLLRYGEFDVVVFGDETILNHSVEEWPLCDCLLCWHSGEASTERAGTGLPQLVWHLATRDVCAAILQMVFH